MRLADVVRQLQLLLPKYTPLLGDVLDIVAISSTSTKATITTSTLHNLVTGSAVVLSGVETKTEVPGVSQDGLIYTFTTGVDHDLTFNSPDHVNATLEGFTDSDWNDSFIITSVPNRRTFKVRSTNTIPTLNGNETLQEVRSDGVNGRYRATAVSPTSFTIDGTFLASNYSGGRVSANVRVAGGVTLARVFEQYTKQKFNDLWVFVVMTDPEVSKDRNTKNDSTASLASGTEMRQKIMDGFELFIFQNVSNDIAATTAIDVARHDLMQPIMKSVYGAEFSSGLDVEFNFRTVFTSQGFVDYTKSVLVYSYQFQSTYDLTDGDMVESLDTRAYRDTDMTLVVGSDDTTDMTVTIDHDSEPL